MTMKCMQNDLGHFACDNTHNNPALFSKLDSPYNDLQLTSCVNHNNKVIFMHLGRGTPKLHGNYTKSGRVSTQEWCDLLQDHLHIDLSPLHHLGS